jgi:hypothetical protein
MLVNQLRYCRLDVGDAPGGNAPLITGSPKLLRIGQDEDRGSVFGIRYLIKYIGEAGRKL